MENSPLCERSAMFLQQTALETFIIVPRAPHRGRRAAPGPGLHTFHGRGAGTDGDPGSEPRRSAAELRGGDGCDKTSR